MHWRGFRIEGVFNCQMGAAFFTLAGKSDGTSLGQIGDAVRNGIFDERLEKKWRKLKGTGNLLEVFFHAEAGAEADLLDRKIAMKEREFFRERHAGFFAKPKSHAKKFG